VARRAGAGPQRTGPADVCWVPIASGLTPHGLRHSYKTLMIEVGTPATLMDAQMGHADGSVQARYSHVTEGMTGRLLDGLTEVLANGVGRAPEAQPAVTGCAAGPAAGRGDRAMIVSPVPRSSPRFLQEPSPDENGLRL
jgi:Phage integrase family